MILKIGTAPDPETGAGSSSTEENDTSIDAGGTIAVDGDTAITGHRKFSKPESVSIPDSNVFLAGIIQSG